MLPDFDENGNLPPGVHVATIKEVIERFWYPANSARRARSSDLKLVFDVVSEVAIGLYIDGSYITSKLAPGDIDVAIILPQDFDIGSNLGWRVKQFMKKHSLDVYPYRKGIVADEERLRKLVEFWCKDRDGNPKGIIYVEIRP